MPRQLSVIGCQSLVIGHQSLRNLRHRNGGRITGGMESLSRPSRSEEPPVKRHEQLVGCAHVRLRR
jgi:hypothetical protein